MKIAIEDRFTDLDLFRMFNVDMGAAMSHITGEDVSISEDLWHESARFYRGNSVDNSQADLIPHDLTKTARQIRVEHLTEIYKGLELTEESPFPDPVEVLSE